jgi:hypothetical protein
MPGRAYKLHGVRVLVCSAEGTELRTDRDAVDLIGAAWEHRAAFRDFVVGRIAATRCGS